MKLAAWAAKTGGRKSLPLAEAYGPGSGHQVGMERPEGGFVCATCRHVSDDGKKCDAKYFRAWQATKGQEVGVLPKPAADYCCDFWAAP